MTFMVRSLFLLVTLVHSVRNDGCCLESEGGFTSTCTGESFPHPMQLTPILFLI